MFQRLIGWTLFATLLCTSARADEATYTLVYAGGKTVSITRVSDKKWTATESGATLTVELGEKNSVTLLAGDTRIAEAEAKGGKIKLAEPNGTFYLEIKFQADKTKVTVTDGEDPYEFKAKDDKIKVARGSSEYGKIKYYPDTGKLKVKDLIETEVAVSRDIKQLTAAPGVFAIPNLEAQKRTFIMLVLFAFGK
ncbi:MAG: hypothetical protein JXR37_11640 [Kiritimatiellae bacterium]|nr:hypothetical protein [Kiritimatiellia bacterium]